MYIIITILYGFYPIILFFIYSKQLFFSIECCINLEINYFQYIFALSDIIKLKELRTLIIYSKSVNDDLNANWRIQKSLSYQELSSYLNTISQD